MNVLADGSLTSGTPNLDSDGECTSVSYPCDVIPIRPPPPDFDKSVDDVRQAKLALTDVETRRKLDLALLEESTAVYQEAKMNLQLAIHRLHQSLGVEPT